MSGPNWILLLVIGLLAGWLAGMVTKGRGFGVPGDLVGGVIGALVGGWVFSSLGITTYGLFGLMLTALAGSLLLLSVIRLIKTA